MFGSKSYLAFKAHFPNHWSPITSLAMVDSTAQITLALGFKHDHCLSSPLDSSNATACPSLVLPSRGALPKTLSKHAGLRGGFVSFIRRACVLLQP